MSGLYILVRHSMWDQILHQGLGIPCPLQWEGAQILNHWTTKESPEFLHFFIVCIWNTKLWLGLEPSLGDTC